MVLLTMTPSIVDGLKKLDEQRVSHSTDDDASKSPTEHDKQSLLNPSVGNPISHGQIIDLWKTLDALEAPSSSHSLERLLQGSRVFIAPPAPKPEPSEEYKALMARLRREEDARSYERMINPPVLPDSFQNRFPDSAHAYAEANRPTTLADIGEDDINFNEVHRQVMLIINFLVSIVGVAATLWIAGRWWSVSSRLFLTLGGSILVAIAEVAVYSGYMWRMGEAQQKQSAVKEVKEVVKTWVVGEEMSTEDNDKTILVESKRDGIIDSVRKRVPAAADKHSTA